MLDGITPIKRVKCALLSAVVMLGSFVGEASAGEWPVVLPTQTFGDLPKDQGMAFFIGTWQQTSRFEGGGDMTVTRNSIEFRQSSTPTYSPYKVLHEGPNYVLLVTKDTFRDGDQWTRFRIFTAQSLGSQVALHTNLRSYSCSELSMERPEPFDWPVEKLLDAFKTSRCLKKMDIDGTVSIGWSSDRFQRARPY